MIPEKTKKSKKEKYEMKPSKSSKGHIDVLRSMANPLKPASAQIYGQFKSASKKQGSSNLHDDKAN